MGWAMILEGKTQKEVVDYWLKNDVHRITKITRKNKLLCQTGQQVDLRQVNPNFKPMITEDECNAVREIS